MSSNVWDGNHMFIWQADKVYGGDANQMIAKAKQFGYRGVIIKFANGSLKGDSVSQGYMDQFKKYAPAFKQAGFIVGGWIYQYLTDIQGEVDACSQAVSAGADWIVLDGEADLNGKGAAVTEFGKKLRNSHPQLPVGLSSFPLYARHTDFPYQEFTSFVNVLMPQIYWSALGMSVQQAVNDTLTEYRGQFSLPIAPTGQAYHQVTPQQMQQFIQLCSDSHLPGISWWDWQEASDAQLQATQTNVFASGSGGTSSSGDTGNGGTSSGANSFSDVPSGAWYTQAVQQVVQDGLMKGYPDGTFRPEQPVTRAELAVVLTRLNQPANSNNS